MNISSKEPSAAAIEQKARQILTSGYIPQDRKNMLHWALLTSVICILSLSAFAIGHNMAAKVMLAGSGAAIHSGNFSEIYPKQPDFLSKFN